jgi:hypothetical protein
VVSSRTGHRVLIEYDPELLRNFHGVRIGVGFQPDRDQVSIAGARFSLNRSSDEQVPFSVFPALYATADRVSVERRQHPAHPGVHQRIGNFGRKRDVVLPDARFQAKDGRHEFECQIGTGHESK